MTKWEITKYVKHNPTFPQRLYAYFFVAPNDILLPGYEWKNNGKTIYQSKIITKKYGILKIVKE